MYLEDIKARGYRIQVEWVPSGTYHNVHGDNKSIIGGRLNMSTVFGLKCQSVGWDFGPSSSSLLSVL